MNIYFVKRNFVLEKTFLEKIIPIAVIDSFLTGLHNSRAVNVLKVSTFFSVSKTRLSRWVVCTLLGKNAFFQCFRSIRVHKNICKMCLPRGMNP